MLSTCYACAAGVRQAEKKPLETYPCPSHGTRLRAANRGGWSTTQTLDPNTTPIHPMNYPHHIVRPYRLLAGGSDGPQGLPGPPRGPCFRGEGFRAGRRNLGGEDVGGAPASRGDRGDARGLAGETAWRRDGATGKADAMQQWFQCNSGRRMPVI